MIQFNDLAGHKLGILLWNDYAFNVVVPTTQHELPTTFWSYKIVLHANIVIDYSTNEIIKNRFKLCSPELMKGLEQLIVAELLSWEEVSSPGFIYKQYAS